MADNYWWFGINNGDEKKSGPKDDSHKRDQKKTGHVMYFPYFDQFLKGYLPYFNWERNKQKHPGEYDSLSKDDSVMFWMGHGKKYPQWGIIGFGYIDEIIGHKSIFRLKVSYYPEIPIIPHEQNNPRRTEVTDFLLRTFQSDFPPLGKLFHSIEEYGNFDISNSIAETVAEINDKQFKACLDFARKIN